MDNPRRIRKIIKSMPTVEGAGVHLRRAFGFQYVPELDPFLLLDEFHSGNQKDYRSGFPWHPHRGIETITYVLEGEIRHEDSLGNKGLIRPGDSKKMTEPRYQEIKSKRIPEILMGKGLKMRIISGDVNGVEGPAKGIATNPEYLDVTVPADEKFSHMTMPDYTVFAYVIGEKGILMTETAPALRK